MKKLVIADAGDRCFEIDSLIQKVVAETAAMGYHAVPSSCENGYYVDISRDMGGMDTFLGRWQFSKVKIYHVGSTLYMDVLKRDKIDKIVCFLIGPLFFAIPWILGFIARANRRDIERVVAKIVDDFAVKLRLAE